MLNVPVRSSQSPDCVLRHTDSSRNLPRRPTRPWLVAVVIICLAVGALPKARSQSGPLEELTNFPHATLDISSGKHRKAHYDIWIADTPAREEQGLMFVRELPAAQGMLFPENPPREMRMWMKNTFIELDMVFVGTDGRILRIVEHAVPHSLETIDSGGVVSAVLEIRGGQAQKMGLRLGDTVRWTAPTLN